ncbi:hypothetical protein CSV86_005445 [Pseudomonas putida CSV86]|uniref:Uncharacterized protein n=1 Tax=Pseudomonas bharatica CSV86 TaxID=1005395 RepID=L1M5B3_9PSED|nr:hypothetical protein [Pseudomonas bharatica]NNJ14727.1 hypothetical protein [Pseudomonas bharatica CSV86]
MTKKMPALLPDHPMYIDAVDAMKQYHEARASGSSAEEVERLRLIAESQFRAVSEYQLKALGSQFRRPH